MGAIDLLLRTKPNSERMHQIVLSTLLSRSNLLRHLHFEAVPDGTFEWEPAGGRCDIKVGLTDGGAALVELKIDSGLGDEQVERQVRYFLGQPHHGRRPLLLYIVLGSTRFIVDSREFDRLIERAIRLSSGEVDRSRIHLRNLDDLVEGLEKLVIDSEDSSDVRDLGGAYLASLLEIQRVAPAYVSERNSDWLPDHFLQFFSDFYAQVPLAGSNYSRFGYVPNQSGGFYGCWWGWRPLALSEDRGPWCYLQFEMGHGDGSRDKFVIKVEQYDKTQQSAVRDRYFHKVMEAAKELNTRLVRPSRMGKGTWMTVAEIPDVDIRGLRRDGTMDWDAIRAVSAQALSLVERGAELYRQQFSMLA